MTNTSESEKRRILLEFYKAVCALAEQNMMKPPYKLEGAHYNAMKTILKEQNIDVD